MHILHSVMSIVFGEYMGMFKNANWNAVSVSMIERDGVFIELKPVKDSPVYSDKFEEYYLRDDIRYDENLEKEFRRVREAYISYYASRPDQLNDHGIDIGSLEGNKRKKFKR